MWWNLVTFICMHASSTCRNHSCSHNNITSHLEPSSSLLNLGFPVRFLLRPLSFVGFRVTRQICASTDKVCLLLCAISRSVVASQLFFLFLPLRAALSDRAAEAGPALLHPLQRSPGQEDLLLRRQVDVFISVSCFCSLSLIKGRRFLAVKLIIL